MTYSHTVFFCFCRYVAQLEGRFIVKNVQIVVGLLSFVKIDDTINKTMSI